MQILIITVLLYTNSDGIRMILQEVIARDTNSESATNKPNIRVYRDTK